nr:PAAR domain-containing protein [Tritonibacter horizontis]
MVSPLVPPVPHVGGPVAGPSATTVLTCGLPQAIMGDAAICVGPPDTLAKGSSTVIVCGKPAVRIVIDTCAHGGMVSVGAPTVIIGG